MGLMPVHRSGDDAAWALKTICVVPDNPQRGLDAHQGAVALFDGQTGQIRAIMNASAITAIRTAAVSAVATSCSPARTLPSWRSWAPACRAARASSDAPIRDWSRIRIVSRTPGAPEQARLGDRRGGDREPRGGGAQHRRRRHGDELTHAGARRGWLRPGAHNAVGSSIASTRGSTPPRSPTVRCSSTDGSRP